MNIKFKQGISGKLGKAPHKPILMLAVIEAFNKGLIQENKIYITPELLSLFRGFWDSLVTTNHTPNFALPFFHLQNEKQKYWFLESSIGLKNAITSSHSIRSLKALQQYVYYAYLSDELYIAISQIQSRNELKKSILKRYFNMEQVHVTYDALGDAMNHILNDDVVTYKKSVIEEINEPREIQEEKQFIRGAAFKKTIPKIYKNTCAITGLSVDATINVSMIDACHIIPFAESYNDTITNGIALSPNMHRAFDRGLISIDNNYRVLVSSKFIESDSVYSIRQFEGSSIILPEKSSYYPSLESLAYHRKRFSF